MVIDSQGQQVQTGEKFELEFESDANCTFAEGESVEI